MATVHNRGKYIRIQVEPIREFTGTRRIEPIVDADTEYGVTHMGVLYESTPIFREVEQHHV